MTEQIPSLKADTILIINKYYVRTEIKRHECQEEKRHIKCPTCFYPLPNRRNASRYLGYLQCPFCKTLYKKKGNRSLLEITLQEVKPFQNKKNWKNETMVEEKVEVVEPKKTRKPKPKPKPIEEEEED